MEMGASTWDETGLCESEVSLINIQDSQGYTGRSTSKHNNKKWINMMIFMINNQMVTPQKANLISIENYLHAPVHKQ